MSAETNKKKICMLDFSPFPCVCFYIVEVVLLFIFSLNNILSVSKQSGFRSGPTLVGPDLGPNCFQRIISRWQACQEFINIKERFTIGMKFYFLVFIDV